MRTLVLLLTLASGFASLAPAQSVLSGTRAVRAFGEGRVAVKPDQVKINIGVVTEAPTAEAAATENAAVVEKVIARLRQLLGPSAEIETIIYSVNPTYRYPQGGPPTLIGYTASNTIEVTTSDLVSIGRVIDAATEAGANNIGGLRFSVKDPEPLRTQALATAARQARSHAEAIAGGLGARTGAVVFAQEGVEMRVIPVDVSAAGSAAGGATTTPIETGLIEIRAKVTVELELI